MTFLRTLFFNNTDISPKISVIAVQCRDLEQKLNFDPANRKVDPKHVLGVFLIHFLRNLLRLYFVPTLKTNVIQFRKAGVG
jgi:hypothetical protein